jgi:hypothetical protein
LLRKAYQFIQTPVHIAPLVVLRIIIGTMMIFSTARFMMFGWVSDHYTEPVFHFKYFGFEWIEVLPPIWMYAIHLLMLLSALCVMIGFYFRWASIMLFLIFTYTELLDLTYYLNHYYFVSLILLLVAISPAHRHFSFDSFRKQNWSTEYIPRLWICIFQFLLAIVYTYAGLAKINHDWLVNALPLKIWLPAHDKLPIIGDLLTWSITPFAFSWFGMLYDCTIIWWLMYSRTRVWAYMAVIVFHLITGILFQIGVFPLVMIAATLIFFSERWHVQLLNNLKSFFNVVRNKNQINKSASCKPVSLYLVIAISLFFLFHLVFPWRYLVYPGNLFWTEEGYRFSWRVMLMEKAGTATFYVKDAKTLREGVVVNAEFLNPHQEKQMAMQPDLILQFAHFLHDHYEAKGVNDPRVRAEVYVTLNAKPSQLLIDPTINLASIEDGWKYKSWILPAPK